GGDELAKAVREFQRIEAESVREGMRAYPGVREALDSLAAWELAAVTNKRRDTSIEALRVTGLLSLFALVLGGDSVPHKKPAPDPILRAASALGVAPAECAVVGDTENDVVAGKAAGARTDVAMSALTRISRSPSRSTPQRGRGVIFGSNPMLTITASTSRTVFFSVRLSYTTARSTFPLPSRLVTSALKSTSIWLSMTA